MIDEIWLGKSTLMLWILISILLGIFAGSLFSFVYNSKNNRDITIEEKINNLSDQMYIEYMAEQKVLDRIDNGSKQTH